MRKALRWQDLLRRSMKSSADVALAGAQRTSESMAHAPPVPMPPAACTALTPSSQLVSSPGAGHRAVHRSCANAACSSASSSSHGWGVLARAGTALMMAMGRLASGDTSLSSGMPRVGTTVHGAVWPGLALSREVRCASAPCVSSAASALASAAAHVACSAAVWHEAASAAASDELISAAAPPDEHASFAHAPSSTVTARAAALRAA
mmetsp:Transcript_6717/g.17190  ORF Transcript_6717/g.17190 Transcript_6717/m.17190 type:complete len:207 (+) Transcript_6717:189-809(+)